MKLPAVLSVCILSLPALPLGAVETTPLPEATSVSTEQVIGRNSTRGIIYRYQRVKPSDSTSNSESAAYFHPLTTPKGLVVTEVGPDDHRHHRGVFFAWVNMQGATKADFWGWGALAPIEGRRVVNRSVEAVAAGGFLAQNEWLAGDEVLIQEALGARAAVGGENHVLDLNYSLTPKIDLTLPRVAFSGFCVRVRKGPDIAMYDPAGLVKLPSPSHEKPETGWPDRAWYACAVSLPEGRGGVAAISHPSNPPALWHNVSGIGMLNPCVAAPAELALPKDRPLTLRYRIVSFDGDVPTEKLNALAAEFAQR